MGCFFSAFPCPAAGMRGAETGFALWAFTFFSSDYFPLLPWVFVFFFGVFLGRLAKEGKFPRFFAASHIPFFAFTGRHALLIYILHQPVILGISYGVQALLSLGRG